MAADELAALDGRHADRAADGERLVAEQALARCGQGHAREQVPPGGAERARARRDDPAGGDGTARRAARAGLDLDVGHRALLERDRAREDRLRLDLGHLVLVTADADEARSWASAGARRVDVLVVHHWRAVDVAWLRRRLLGQHLRRAAADRLGPDHRGVAGGRVEVHDRLHDRRLSEHLPRDDAADTVRKLDGLDVELARRRTRVSLVAAVGQSLLPVPYWRRTKA